ncbi:MAG: tetratricopeptide repeat protein [Oliverpabstia sp.]
MDKTEYRMRLDEINRLVEAQDYEGALAVADSIEWKRVKSVRTLCMVADIYEVNGELEESMNILKLAYKRSSVGKMILYRQVELALKMKKNDDAVNYYNQYLETAANDTSKYILKYKIYKAQDAPLDEQIAILEEYKDREYTERWVYELAKLYKKAGKQNKCIENCDDLILWFGEGKYVAKAMELKMSYVPLTPDQKAKYDRWNQGEQSGKPVRPAAPVTAATVAGISAAAMESLQKASVIPKEQVSTVKNKDGSTEYQKILSEDNSSVMEEAAATKDPVMPVHVDTAQLQEKLAKSFQEVLSGFNRTKVVNAFEALGKAAESEMPPEPEQEGNIEDYQVTELEPETVNETKISADRGSAIEHRTEITEAEKPVKVKEEKPEDKEVISVQDMDLEALFAETSSLFAEAVEQSDKRTDSEILDENPETEEEQAPTEEESENEEVLQVQEQPELSADEAAAMAAFEASLMINDENIADSANESEPEEIVLEEPDAEEFEPETIILEEPDTEEVEPEEIVLEEPDTEDTELEEIVLEEPDAEESLSEKIVLEQPDEEKFESEVIILEESERAEKNVDDLFAGISELADIKKEDSDNESLIPDLDLSLIMELQERKEDPGFAEIDAEAIFREEDFHEEPEGIVAEQSESEEILKEEPEPEEIHVEEVIETMPVVEAETPEEKRMRILNETRPEYLTDEQKRLFSYFSKVPGMDEQILNAINGVFEHVNEKTSRQGNIAIMGSHGTGKTRLSEGLVKAICKQLGLQAVKYASLDASDMNRKDPAAVISKMAGGFLLIERASFMTAETIEKLSRAMDFRTDSMILLIEDDKANMRKLLADYPEFAKKFDTVISIPVFTNDELVTFARTYAKENGYRIDEMGVLALYTLIGDNQREDEPITIGKVKDMVDKAIRRAGSARLGRRISKRHADADGRILLYEKDFEL